MEEAYKTVKVPFPIEPHSEASLEEQEKYQQEVDDFPNKLQKAVEEFVFKKLEQEKEELRKKNKDALYSEYEKLVIDDMCSAEMVNGFKDYCISHSAYKDENYTTNLFKNVEEYKNLPSEIKNQFEAEYESIELDVETLKKLREAMPS